MTLNPDGPFTREALRRALRAGPGALALSLLAAGCAGGADSSPTGSDGATVGPIAAPTVSPSIPVDVPLVLTLHPNFFPAKQADAKAIPWDEVGPGWFLVDSHQQLDVDYGDEGVVPMSEAVGGLSLVSPEGDWYAARSFAGTGAAFSVHWAADGVWLMTGVDAYFDGYEGDLVRLDLATGVSVGIATDQWLESDYVGASGGVTLVQGFSQEFGGPYGVYTSAGAASVADCRWQMSVMLRGDFRVALAPDGRTVVCWRGRIDGKTDIGTLDLGSPSAATYLDVFRLDPWQYEQLGWLSDDTFLLARLNDNGAVEAYFAYNVVSRTIEDFALPFTPGTGQMVEAFDYESQVYISSYGQSDSIDLHRANGEKIATAGGGCADGWAPSWSLSGTSLLTTCPWAGGAVTLIDLETGNVVGTWPYGSELAVLADGYPQHAG